MVREMSSPLFVTIYTLSINPFANKQLRWHLLNPFRGFPCITHKFLVFLKYTAVYLPCLENCLDQLILYRGIACIVSQSADLHPFRGTAGTSTIHLLIKPWHRESMIHFFLKWMVPQIYLFYFCWFKIYNLSPLWWKNPQNLSKVYKKGTNFVKF